MSRFSLVEVLAQRKYTSIYKVQDDNTGKIYLAKSISANADVRIQNGFSMEVEVLSALENVRIPALVDAFYEEGRKVLVESWLPYPNLALWLKEKHGLAEKLSLIQQAASILDCLHEAGYLYLDLKPENFLVDGNVLWMIDFNSCIRMNAKKVYFCSQSRMAPEIYTDEEKTAAADVFALGTLMQDFLLPAPYRKYAARLVSNKERRPENMKAVLQDLDRLKAKKKGIKAASLIILSVFMLFGCFFAFDLAPASAQFSKDSSSISMVEEFEKNLEQGKSASAILSGWIDSGLIDEETMSREGSAAYLARRALETDNSAVCAWVFKRLPESFSSESPVLYLLLEEMSARAQVSKESLNRAFEAAVLQDSRELASLVLQHAISSQFVLEEEMQLMDFIRERQDEQFNILFLRYLLISRSLHESGLTFEQSWLQGSEEEAELFEMYSWSLQAQVKKGQADA